MAASSAFRPLNAGLTECSGLRNMLARSTAWRTFRLLCCGGVVPVFGCCSGSLLKMVLLWCSRGFFAWFDGAWLDRLLVLGNFRVFLAPLGMSATLLFGHFGLRRFTSFFGWGAYKDDVRAG